MASLGHNELICLDMMTANALVPCWKLVVTLVPFLNTTFVFSYYKCHEIYCLQGCSHLSSRRHKLINQAAKVLGKTTYNDHMPLKTVSNHGYTQTDYISNHYKMCQEVNSFPSEDPFWASLPWLIIDSDNGLAPTGVKPLSEPKMTYSQSNIDELIFFSNFTYY